MKKVFSLFLFIGFSFYVHAQFDNYENGDTVNDFTVTDVNGVTHNLYSYTSAGKYVYLDFFYAACGSCQSFIPIFNEFYDKYGCNEGDVICIAINSGVDRNDAVIEFENTYGGDFNHAPAIASDGGCDAVINDFSPSYYSAKCIIDPDNIIIDSDISPHDSVAYLEAVFPVGFNPSPMECTIGINDYYSNLDFSIFPNPANGDEITIEFQDIDNALVSIYSIQGKKVFASNLLETKQKIYPHLQAGVYFISLQTNTGKGVKKLVIN